MARIYIADDDSDIRNLLTFTLIEEGHEVLVARDGQMALEAVIDDPPDLLILDIMMPGLDGLGVLEGLRSYGVSSGTKVMILSARGSAADQAEGLRLGADRYVTKPFAPEELMEVVRQMLVGGAAPLGAVAERENPAERARMIEEFEMALRDHR